MKETDVTTYLVQENLFDLFKAQLRKDFEGAGASSDYAENLPTEFKELRGILVYELKKISSYSTTLISSLLYRIDISESQIHTYGLKNPTLDFEQTLAELIIKRVLQKVILKKTHSDNNPN